MAEKNNNNIDEFADIRAYRDSDVGAAKKRILKNRLLVAYFTKLKWDKCPFLFKPFAKFAVKMYLKKMLAPIRTIKDYQEELIIKRFYDPIMKRTASELSFSGLENLDPQSGCLFISNHRDITLDVAMIEVTLFRNGFPMTEIAFGSNLVLDPAVEDIIRMNQGFIVKRGLRGREQFVASLRLSRYINQVLSEGRSVWMAQREGRAKDGRDLTNPAILKMLHLSRRKEFPQFGDYIRALRIVPVSISYEFDPLDNLKAWERFRINKHGDHQKRRYEDLVSILFGMRRNKGRIHVGFGRLSKGDDFASEKDLADYLDKQIKQNYRLWPPSYIAFDELRQSSLFQSRYTPEEKSLFLKRFNYLPVDVKHLVLESYAAPLENRDKDV